MKQVFFRISSFCCFSLLRSANVSMMTPKIRLRTMMMIMKKNRRSYTIRATNKFSCNGKKSIQIINMYHFIQRFHRYNNINLIKFCNKSLRFRQIGPSMLCLMLYFRLQSYLLTKCLISIYSHLPLRRFSQYYMIDPKISWHPLKLNQ